MCNSSSTPPQKETTLTQPSGINDRRLIDTTSPSPGATDRVRYWWWLMWGAFSVLRGAIMLYVMSVCEDFEVLWQHHKPCSASEINHKSVCDEV